MVNTVPCAPLQFDANGDGEITLGELQQAMQRLLGDKLTSQEISEVVQEADINGDGTVDFEGDAVWGQTPLSPWGDFFPSWPFLLILPQFEVGGGRVRFGNCLLPHFLPMSFPKAHASHLSLINICTWPLLGTACPEADSDSTFPIPSLFPGHLCYRNRNSHPKEGGLVSCWDAGSDSWGSSSGSSFTNDVVLSQSLSLLQCQISHLQNGGKDDTFLPKFYRKAKRNRALQTPLLVCCLEQPSSFHWLSLSYTPGWCPPPHLSCQARHPRAPITPTAASAVMLTRDT